ncbi:MAG: glycosyltransferase family 4 protein [Candidatus Accumulibacter sp. UW20]
MSNEGKLTRRLKICFVQPVQSPYWTARLRSLARHEDLDLTLLLERDTIVHRPGWAPEPIDGVSIEVVGSSVVTSVRSSDDLGYQIQGVRSIPWRMPLALWRLRPDVVVMCNATQTLLALPTKWFFGARLAITVEDTPHAMSNCDSFNRWAKGWIYRRADCCFAFSEDAREYLAKLGISQGVRRSSWSLDMKSFGSRPVVEPSSSGLVGASPAKTALFIGQLIPRKGILQLLEAWLGLPKETRQRCRLLLVGDGPLREQVEAFICERHLDSVEFIGQIPYTRVKELLSAADLFVLPTLEDLFSLTVVEAMASGCAVVTTPFNGARELVDEGRNGWVVDPSVPGALTATLQHGLSSETDLMTMGLAARLRVEQMDNVKVMDDFAQSLRHLVGGMA